MGGWFQQDDNDTFKKKRSKTATRRTQSTYTLRGRDLSVQQTLRKLAKQYKTLGSGNLLRIVDIPEDMIADCADRLRENVEDWSEQKIMEQARKDARLEWLAANTVDFYNEVSLLYGMVEEFHQNVSTPSKYERTNQERVEAGKPKLTQGFSNGFPRGFEYRVKDKNKVTQKTGAEYVNLSMIWLEDQIDDQAIFPEDEDAPFPDDFVEVCQEMFKRMFRVFAIIYAVCWDIVKDFEAEAHINTCFKHFYFFMTRYSLLKKKQDKDVFLKTKVKNWLDLRNFDKEYQKLLQEYEQEQAAKKDV